MECDKQICFLVAIFVWIHKWRCHLKKLKIQNLCKLKIIGTWVLKEDLFLKWWDSRNSLIHLFSLTTDFSNVKVMITWVALVYLPISHPLPNATNFLWKVHASLPFHHHHESPWVHSHYSVDSLMWMSKHHGSWGVLLKRPSKSGGAWRKVSVFDVHEKAWSLTVTPLLLFDGGIRARRSSLAPFFWLTPRRSCGWVFK